MEEHIIHAPQLGESVRFLKVREFLKKPGDTIKIDEPIIVVETDKASMEIESPVSGVIYDFKVAIHDEVPIGQELASIRLSSAADMMSTTEKCLEKFKSSNWNTIYKNKKTIPLDEYLDIPLSVPQLALVSHMTRSHGKIIQAHLKTVCESKLINAIRSYYRKQVTDGAAIPSSTEIFAWCTLKAMRQHPRFCSMLLDNGEVVRQFKHPIIGVAVGMPDDELAIFITSDRLDKNMLNFSKDFKQKLSQTKSGVCLNGFHSLSLSDLSAFDVEAAVPVIVAPAVATLCIGRIYGKSREDHLYSLSLSFDHRIINGVGAASFLKTIKKELCAFSKQLVGTGSSLNDMHLVPYEG